jgi:hypothetical protein
LYQDSSKFPNGFRRTCKNKVFFKENVKSRGHNSLKNNWTGLPLQYAHLHNVTFLCAKFHQNPPKEFRRSSEDKEKGKGR